MKKIYMQRRDSYYYDRHGKTTEHEVHYTLFRTDTPEDLTSPALAIYSNVDGVSDEDLRTRERADDASMWSFCAKGFCAGTGLRRKDLPPAGRTLRYRSFVYDYDTNAQLDIVELEEFVGPAVEVKSIKFKFGQ